MNPLASIAKNLRELEASYGKIKSEETREKAQIAIGMACGRMAVPPLPNVDLQLVAFAKPESVSVASGGSVTLEADLGRVGENNVTASVSVGSVGVTGIKTEWKDGVTTVYPVEKPFVDEGEPGPGACLPVVPEEPAVEGDVGGSSGTFYPETVESPVEMIGGWPERSEINVVGLFPNRRSLRGLLPDGRGVHVERRMDWKVGMIRGRLVRAGAAPLYRTI